MAVPSKPPATQSHQTTADNHGNANEGHPPQMVQSPFEAALLEELRTIASQQETARREDEANEKRWWPPSPSWAIVYVTVVYVIVASFQWCAIRRQANIAEITLTETSRPWVSPFLQVIGNGLSYDNIGARVAVRGVFRNTGHSPALDARFYMRLALYVGGDNPVDIQTEYINQIRNMGEKSPQRWGITVFPGGEAAKIEELRLTWGDIDKSKRGPTGAIHPIVVGFIEYRFAFSTNENEIHCTRSMYEMAALINGRMVTPNAGSNIPLNYLLFFASPSGGHEAT